MVKGIVDIIGILHIFSPSIIVKSFLQVMHLASSPSEHKEHSSFSQFVDNNPFCIILKYEVFPIYSFGV